MISFIRKYCERNDCINNRRTSTLDGMNHGLIVWNLVRKNTATVYYSLLFFSTHYRSPASYFSIFITHQIVVFAVYIPSSSHSTYVYALSYQLYRFYHKFENTTVRADYFNHHLSAFMWFITHGSLRMSCQFQIYLLI